MDSLDAFPALVLNADYRPLSYHPLSVWPWQEAVKAVLADRVAMLAEHEVRVRSPTLEMALPSVVALREYQPLDSYAAFTRANIYGRDGWTCQYCGGRFPTAELTFDHVLPRSRGGRTTWENVVSACQPCNARKADRTPEEAGMPLLRRPWRPTKHQIARRSGALRERAVPHASWADWLYWESELEA